MDNKYPSWEEAKKRPINTRYGPIEVPTEDCYMPDGTFYSALTIYREKKADIDDETKK